MYSLSNFKLLVEKQMEIDTIYQNCYELKKTTVAPKIASEVQQFFTSVITHLEQHGFTVTMASSKLIAQYKQAQITIDKHSKDLEECIFINLNNYVEDQLSIMLDIESQQLDQHNSTHLDGFSSIIEQINGKLNHAKNLQNACQAAKLIYKNNENNIFHSADEVVNFYFK
ncbi:hypothetical protein ACIQXI_04375 [Lysinibacillus sp. NPDC097195]|uniref:hypothetical protein n=1 Tax=Lysinibacillus sp. NPDC097195 TaxID=3364141 RepID=UPI003823498A